MNNTYNIKKLILLLKERMLAIIIITMISIGISAILALYVVDKEYKTTTSFYVKNNDVKLEKITAVDLNDLDASKSLAETYITVLNSQTVIEEVVKGLEEKYGEDKVKELFNVGKHKTKIQAVSKCFSMYSLNETEVISVSATTKDPEVSMVMCAIMDEIAPEFLIRIVGAGSVEIIDKAKIEPIPVFPKVPIFLVAGCIIGFNFSILLILIIDMFDNTIKDNNDVIKNYNMPLLGTIDYVKETNENKDLLINKVSPFNYIESYKSIRTNILFALGAVDKNVVAVSSSNPGEGKSTISANIAIALAQANHRVLLIDADMRKPVQHKLFNVENKHGLSTLIIGQSDIDNAINVDVSNNLDIITSGPIPPNPSELLASERFYVLIKGLASSYDYVIIDTPPVNVVSDIMIMNNVVSGILLVLKSSNTSHDDINNSIRQIRLSNTNILGFVMNEASRKKKKKYGRYKYKYEYEYKYEEKSNKKHSKQEI